MYGSAASGAEQGGSSEIFISYRNIGDEFAAAFLYEKLCEEFGKESVFLAGRSIPAGSHFPDVLWRELGMCRVLLAVIGKDWLAASKGGRRLLDNRHDFVRGEIAMALNLHLRVIPVLLEDTPMPTKDQLPKSIARLSSQQYVRLSVRTAPSDIARLTDEIRRILM